ncbi:MAG: hypothetical protein RJA44_1847, partial [Pseudomonadota bacterium]
LDAAVMKDGLVRCDTLPLVLRATGAEALPRNARVRIRLSAVDLLTLEAHASVIARIDDPAASTDDAAPDDESGDGDEAPAAGGLALAIDLQDGDADATAAPAGA